MTLKELANHVAHAGEKQCLLAKIRSGGYCPNCGFLPRRK